MIQTVNLTKSFGHRPAVDGVTLHIKEKEIFGLVGPDGAGKTTLLRMICGLITPDRGSVTLLGYSGREIERAKAHLGYMPQRFSLYGDLTVLENINFFGALYNLSRRTISERGAEVLAITRLHGFEGRLADHLSGGMKQKLALTCALITRPRLLVLDEPTYGVDPESRKEFWKILYRLNREGMTVMVSTPYMDEAELCHRVGFINNGQVAACGTPLELRRAFPHRILEVQAASRDPDLFRDLPEVLEASFYGDRYHLVVADPKSVQQAIEGRLLTERIRDAKVREVSPSMEDVFVYLAEGAAG
jgi:ABC-2 type transport system ATP-binding protein